MSNSGEDKAEWWDSKKIELNQMGSSFVQLEPSLKIRYIISILFISLVSYIYIFISIKGGTELIDWLNKHSRPEDVGWLSNPLKWFVTIIDTPIIYFAPIFVATYLVMRSLKRDFSNKQVEFERYRETYNKEIDEIKNEVVKFKNVETVVYNSINKIFQEPEGTKFYELIHPGNEALSERLSHTIRMFGVLHTLPDDIKSSITAIVGTPNKEGKTLRDYEWGELYLKFAFQLQLEPWKRAVTTEQFCFIRSIEEYKARGDNAIQCEEYLINRLGQDLTVLLNLVNGKLYSIIYRDLHVWNDPNYIKENDELYDRKKTGCDLKRVFIFNRDWLNIEDKFLYLLLGALWHHNSNYPCYFVEDNIPPVRGIISHQNFISSCLINHTVINMYEEKDGDNLKLFKYDADSTTDTVNIAVKFYNGIWNGNWNGKNFERKSPLEFIKYLYSIDSAKLDSIKNGRNYSGWFSKINVEEL